MKAKLVLRSISGTELTETKLISFSFVKEAYTPYTTLSAKIQVENKSLTDVSEALLYVNEKLIHHGLIDSTELYENECGMFFSVTSRGFTSLLCQNQIEPGLISNISVNALMDSYYALPYVTHEDNSDTSGYIYVKNNSTMWDGVVNLSYKLTGVYPYIRGTNCVRITQEQAPVHFSYNEKSLIAIGTASEHKRLISHFHMSDIEGNFGTYALENTEASQSKIVRHKFFELDMQFLYNPQQALEYRNKYASRAGKRYFCRYIGYNGEDLSDTVDFGQIQAGRIGKISVKGSESGIITELSVYSDGFYTA